MEIDVAVQIEVETICSLLEQLNYYQILKVEPNVPQAGVKDGFFRESRRLHPDRYFGLEDEAFKANVLKIYKRIAEAYGVLKDPEIRRIYDEQLAQGGPTRLDRTAIEQASRKSTAAPDAAAGTQQGRRFLSLGLDRLRRKDYSGAVMNLQFALNAEPGNKAIEAHLEEAREALEAQKQDQPSGAYKLRF